MIKKIIAVVVILLLTAGAGVGGAYLKSTQSHAAGGEAGEGKSAKPKQPLSYQKLTKPLTIPILKNVNGETRVIATVVAEITFEVASEELKEAIRVKEPKLCDAFLQVFYQQIGEGDFEQTMLTERVQAQLRRDLLKTARNILETGDDLTSVLINDMQRQDQ